MTDYYDSWAACKTKNGFNADEVISTLQKEIRRNKVENAARCAYEMIITSAALEDYLWQRLRVISVEDIGFGNLEAPQMVNNLDDMRRKTDILPERILFSIHAIRIMCSSLKDRSSDEMMNYIMKSDIKLEIPDYAYDKHTMKGLEMGRGALHFWKEGAIVEPELKTRETKYHDFMLDKVTKEEN